MHILLSDVETDGYPVVDSDCMLVLDHGVPIYMTFNACSP